MQHNCTSTFKTTKHEDGKISVDVCHTHYGHERQLQHTWLAKTKRQEIAALLQQGVSRERILGDIREEAMQQGDDFKRSHLTGKKDLSNIMASFGIDDVQRHADDQESVRAWVEEWRQSENNPVLFCKFQVEDGPEGIDLAKDDFMIIIQSPFQKVMSNKFATKGICVDATHGTNGYDFPLTSLVVLDEYWAGFPIAWCLSNHEDFTHMCIFFNEIKKNCGILTPRWFMSDLASQFYNAWIGVMGGTPLRLVCTWHVDKAWQEELRAKVKDTIVAAEIYKMLRTVLQETSVTSFQDYFSQLLERLPALSLEFSQYFKREWSGKKEWWAYCYRRGLGINTNMVVEAFHRVFKYSYLKGKCNKRVDNCLINLLKYVRDKSFERVIRITKGKNTHKLNVIHDRHNKSKEMNIDDVECIDDGLKWVVKNEDGQHSYTITKHDSSCTENDCQMKCIECQTCVHQYTCNCPDCLIQNTICKHIHLLRRFLSNEDQMDSSNSHQLDNFFPSQEYADNEVRLVASHLHKKDQVDTNNDTTTLKQAIKGKLLLLQECLNEECNDKEALQQLDKQLNAAHHLYLSMRKRKPLLQLKVTKNTPANKNIEVQRRFKSTKKKRKRTGNVRFMKPTNQDICSLFSHPSDDKGIVSHFRTCT